MALRESGNAVHAFWCHSARVCAQNSQIESKGLSESFRGHPLSCLCDGAAAASRGAARLDHASFWSAARSARMRCALMAQENKLLARNNKTGLRLFSKCQLRFTCLGMLFSAGKCGRIVGGPGNTQKVRLGRSPLAQRGLRIRYFREPGREDRPPRKPHQRPLKTFARVQPPSLLRFGATTPNLCAGRISGLRIASDRRHAGRSSPRPRHCRRRWRRV
jgi:hypothetical protein